MVSLIASIDCEELIDGLSRLSTRLRLFVAISMVGSSTGLALRLSKLGNTLSRLFSEVMALNRLGITSLSFGEKLLGYVRPSMISSSVLPY